MVLKQEGVREISKGIKKFQGFRDENCGILQSTSSGGRELKGKRVWDLARGWKSTSSGGRELKETAQLSTLCTSSRPPREVVN